MKTRFLKSVLPLIAVLIASVGAFAFKNVQEDGPTAMVLGAYKSGVNCVNTSITCSTVETDEPCFSGTQPLYHRLNGTSCPNQVWKIN